MQNEAEITISRGRSSSPILTAFGFGSYAALGAFDHENIELFKVWFNETVPAFLAARPHAAFSLLHIDGDLYESTKEALGQTPKRFAPGDVSLIDEVVHRDYSGATAAFCEVYNHMSNALTLDIRRVQSMLWKWSAVRTNSYAFEFRRPSRILR